MPAAASRLSPLARHLRVAKPAEYTTPTARVVPGGTPIKLALRQLSQQVTLWKALHELGWNDRSLQQNPEVLAWIAMHNGVDDYRKVATDAQVILPRPQARDSVVRLVRSQPDYYIDAVAGTVNGLAKWRSLYGERKVGNSPLRLQPPRGHSATHGPRPAPATTTNTTHSFEPARVLPGLEHIRPRELRTWSVLSGAADKQGLPDTETPLSWLPPVQNVDGTPLTDLAGHKVYYGTSSRSYTTELDVGNVNAFTIHNLPSGTYYFAATSYDLDGNESSFSNEVTKVVP